MSSYAESLVGQYFHIYDEDGLAENQGVVVKRVGDDFICQYFSALTGEPTNSKLHKREDLFDWNFFIDFDAKDREWQSHSKIRMNELRKRFERNEG